ncbi:MAG: flippase-like domain-containing protein, partial [Victivallales bacterium]|nr:flippase-like domain-containing protein [Victivallales bacterium]
MQQWRKKTFYSFVLIGLLLFIYWNTELFYSLRHISFLDLILLFLFGLSAIYINSTQFRYLAEVFDMRLKFKEWFGLSVTNTMHNYYTPARGGTALKAFYLKKAHNLAYSSFISLTAGTYLFGFFLASLSAVFFILISCLLYQQFYETVFLISITLAAATAVIGFFSLKIEFSAVFKKIPRLHKFVLNVEKGLSFFKKNKKLLVKILLFKFLFIVIMAIKLYWAFKAVGIETNLVNILIVQSLVVFSMVLSLTPGNLGIREGIIGLLAAMLDIPLKEAVLGALVDRAVMMCIVIFLGLI